MSTAGGTGKNSSARLTEASRLHMVEIQGKGAVPHGIKGEEGPGRSSGKESLLPAGAQVLPADTSWPLCRCGKCLWMGIDRLEACAGSFSASWTGPPGAQVFLHRCFLDEFHMENIALPNVDGPRPMR